MPDYIASTEMLSNESTRTLVDTREGDDELRRTDSSGSLFLATLTANAKMNQTGSKQRAYTYTDEMVPAIEMCEHTVRDVIN